MTALKERLERVETEAPTAGEAPESNPPPPGATLARPEETEESTERQGTGLRARLEEGFAPGVGDGGIHPPVSSARPDRLQGLHPQQPEPGA